MKVVKVDGVVITGRAVSAAPDSVTLTVTEKKSEREVLIQLADIKRATVEIEFNRKEGDK
jgi:ribosome maturation factor RimP